MTPKFVFKVAQNTCCFEQKNPKLHRVILQFTVQFNDTLVLLHL